MYTFLYDLTIEIPIGLILLLRWRCVSCETACKAAIRGSAIVVRGSRAPCIIRVPSEAAAPPRSVRGLHGDQLKWRIDPAWRRGARGSRGGAAPPDKPQHPLHPYHSTVGPCKMTNVKFGYTSLEGNDIFIKMKMR